MNALSNRYVKDISYMTGSSIKEDLMEVDFTVIIADHL